MTEMRRRLGCGKCSNKNRQRRIGDKRDWAIEDNFDFGSPGSATVQLSVQTEDPGPLPLGKQKLSVGPSGVHEFRPRC